MKSPDHPIWALLRLVVLMITLTVVLWLNASNFDATEHRTIIWVFLAAASTEGISQLVRRRDNQ